jgi:hypothetical protein
MSMAGHSVRDIARSLSETYGISFERAATMTSTIASAVRADRERLARLMSDVKADEIDGVNELTTIGVDIRETTKRIMSDPDLPRMAAAASIAFNDPYVAAAELAARLHRLDAEQYNRLCARHASEKEAIRLASSNGTSLAYEARLLADRGWPMSRAEDCPPKITDSIRAFHQERARVGAVAMRDAVRETAEHNARAAANAPGRYWPGGAR